MFLLLIENYFQHMKEHSKKPEIPRPDVEAAIWCQHVDAWRLERKFTRKYQFAMVEAT